jgi:hypothetical protein
MYDEDDTQEQEVSFDAFDADQRFMLAIIKIAAATLVCIVLIVGGCSVHSHQFEEARMRAEAEQTRADAERVRAHQSDEIAKIEAIERLIQQGIDPIAARCAVKGSHTDDPKCIVASVKGTEPNS